MPRHFKSFRAQLVSSALACAAVAVFPGTARAVPYSSVSAWAIGTSSTTTQFNGGSGNGIASTSLSTNDGAAIFAAQTNTSNTTRTLTIQDSGNNTSTSIVSGGTGGNPGNVALAPNASKGNVKISGPTSPATMTIAGQLATNTSSQVTNTTQIIAGSKTTGASLTNGATQVAAIASNVATAAGSSGSRDYNITTANGAGSITPGRTGVGAGYYVVNVQNQLTGTLTLSGESASDYFFIYLNGGISGAGAIKFASGATDQNASRVIVVLNSALGATQTIGNGSVGTYIWNLTQNASLTIGNVNNSALNGGVFMVNTTSTANDTMTLTSGLTITANPWNGWIAADAPEPMSMAVLGSGLLGMLGLARRRRAA